MKVKGIIYKGKNIYGDFNWMIKQKKYKKVLFIFNDNIEKHFTNQKGKGNAIIRQYNKYNRKIEIPQSAGIPTGSLKEKGFKTLDDDTKCIIKCAIEEIKNLLKKYKYEKIFFSADKSGKRLGTSLFSPGEDVIDYITKKIYKLEFFDCEKEQEQEKEKE